MMDTAYSRGSKEFGVDCVEEIGGGRLLFLDAFLRLDDGLSLRRVCVRVHCVALRC